MLFFYSRKVQLCLLLCWVVGMAFLYAGTAYQGMHFISGALKDSRAREATVVVGSLPPIAPPEAPPTAPVAEPPPVAPPPVASPPPATPDANRITALHIQPQPDTQPPSLVLDLYYVLAGGGTAPPPSVRTYYILEQPTVVLEIRGNWTTDVSFKQAINMPQVSSMTSSTSPKSLRLLLRTQTGRLAAKTRVTMTAGTDNLRAVLYFAE